LFKKIIFFNPYHNGDIHFSREFVKTLIRILPAKEYVYQHNNPHDLISDITELRFEKYEDLGTKHPKGHHMYYELKNNILKFNTWAAVGKFNDLYQKEGITLENNIAMYNYTLSLFSNIKIDTFNKEQYIPVINWNYFKIKYPSAYFNIDNFGKSNNQKKVLICNGKLLSHQCPDFKFEPIIEELAKKEKDILFLLTERRSQSNQKNILYTQDIIGSNQDLNQISYLCTYCDVLVGRSSGPYSTSNVKENWLPKKKGKTIICINKLETDAFWYIPPDSINKFIWLNDYSKDGLINKIGSILVC